MVSVFPDFWLGLFPKHTVLGKNLKTANMIIPGGGGCQVGGGKHRIYAKGKKCIETIRAFPAPCLAQQCYRYPYGSKTRLRLPSPGGHNKRQLSKKWGLSRAKRKAAGKG